MSRVQQQVSKKPREKQVLEVFGAPIIPGQLKEVKAKKGKVVEVFGIPTPPGLPLKPKK